MSTAALSFGSVGDEARHHRERLGARRAQLVDQRAGRDDLALQRRSASRVTRTLTR